MADKSKVLLNVYDLLEGEVAELINAEKEPGIYEIEFVADNIPCGAYICRIIAGSYVEAKKMVVMK